MSRRVRARGKRMQVHVHTEAFRSDPCHGQLMGFPDNIRFDWQTWLNQRLVDGITLRTSWFEAMEEPFRPAPSAAGYRMRSRIRSSRGALALQPARAYQPT